MAVDDVLKAFQIALGFRVDEGSKTTAKRSVADYQRAVEQAEKAIEDARWAGAKSEEEIAKLSRETNLRLAREALQRAKDEDKVEEQKSRKNTERNTAFLANLEKMALAAKAAGAAIRVAMEAASRVFDNLYFQAQRSNTSVQSLRALQYAFAQTGSSAEAAVAAVDSFTTALRDNPGLRKFVSDLGVDDKLQGVDKLMATVDALNKREPYVTARQHADLLGISERDYNHITRQSAALKQYRAEYDELTTTLGVDGDAAAESSAKLARTFTTLQATITALKDRLTVALAPAVDRIVRGFLDWLKANPGEVDRIMRSIAQAIESLATALGKINWKDVYDGIAGFVKGANGAAESIGVWKVAAEAFFALWVASRMAALFAPLFAQLALVRTTLLGMGPIGWAILGLGTLAGALAAADPNKGIVHGGKSPEGSLNPGDELPGVGASTGGSGGADSSPGRARRVWNRIKRAFGGGSAEASTGSGESDETVTTHGHMWRPGANTAAGRERVGSWLNFFQAPVDQGGMGADVETARAMVAMMQGESGSGLNPAAAGDKVNGVKTSFGTAQWHNERFSALQAMAKRMNVAWTDVGAQQQHLRNEMLFGKERGAWTAIKAASTGEAKLAAGINLFERPKYKKKAFDFRVHYLRQLRRQAAPSPEPNATPQASMPAAPPPAAAMRGLPNGMTPGGFDMRSIDPQAALQPAPASASPVTNNQTSSSKTIKQDITNHVKVEGSNNPREHGRVMQSSLEAVHGLALANAQSAIV
ncbi:phage tail tip lysozyme [Methylobacterium sp. E-065]|uniref:phage tail tip lysozyme n=1 Tax=Methylobacterium sp. E-065 TaxID=2836583 RepID=UPI001FBBC89A|nr:phage tail tip lysozyme [Methylobacterium sp. E-065]MCJ2021198.1 phage tail tip lysozyme [Methylobacterium sp. E-065]